MRLITNLKKWSPRVKNAAIAALFLSAYTISLVSPYAFARRAEAFNPPTEPVGNVTICHANNSDSNPYIVNTPSADGVGTNSGTGDHGSNHLGPIWNSTLKDAHISWGDIIPPFTDTNGRSFPGLNWTAAGQLFYANDCNIPVAGVAVAPLACVESGATTTAMLTVTNLVESSTVAVKDASGAVVYTSPAVGPVASVGVNVPNLAAGSYTASVLNGTGSEVASASFTVVVCPPKPAAPGLVAHTPKCSLNGATTGAVSASATNTADATGASATYAWTVTSGVTTVASGTTGSIADGTSDTVSVSNLGPGTYTLSIVGSDQTTASTTFAVPVCQLNVPECTALTGTSVVMKDTQFADWQDTRSSGRYEFLSNGLRIWTVDSTSQAKVAWYHGVNYPLSSVGVPSMDYSVTNGISPGLQLVVDFNNDGTPDGILVGESVYGNNWWLSNSAAQFVKDGSPNTGGGNGSNWFGTLDQWYTAFPNAQVKGVGFSLGSGVLADGVLRSITFGCYKWVFQAPASISGTKYEVNADGKQVGSTGLSGWTVTLYKEDGSIYGSTTTVTGGKYSFTDLLAGKYSVLETNQTGWTQIYNPLNPISLTAGQSANDQNFGNFKNGSISGYKWNDVNGNGVKDGGEETLGGWTISLLDDDEEEISSVETAADGSYSFTNLAPGAYLVCEINPDGSGWLQTYPANKGCHQIEIDKSGEENPGTNFGNQGRGTITVKKNVDSNGDGTVDYYNVDNWTWDLNGLENYSNVATGDSYSKTVGAGEYTIHEDQKDNYHFTQVICTGTNAKYSQAESIAITVEPGANVVCTYTNTRDTGFVKVVKEIYPESDEGLFDLSVDESVEKEDASDGDDTGWVRVVTGEHTLSEVAGSDTDMAHYDSRYYCWDDWELSNQSTDFDWVAGDGTSVDVPVAKGQYIVCSFYNERHAELTIVKDAQPNDAQDFEFTLTPLYRDDVRAAQSPLAKDTVDFSALETSSEEEMFDGSFWLDDDADETLSNSQAFEVSGGRYKVAETPVEGWDLTNIECSGVFPGQEEEYRDGESEYEWWYVDKETGELYMWVNPGSQVTCTFTNTKRATVTITKDAQPNFAQPFTFTTNLGGDEETSFSLTDDGVNGALASRTFSGVVPGTYSVSEAVVNGWTLNGATCIGAEITREGSTVTMEVVPGADVKCTFVNQKNTIPQVLGAVDPPKLENTGGSIWIAVSMSLTVMGLAILTALSDRRRNQTMAV